MTSYQTNKAAIRNWLGHSEIFGLSLKHICLALCDDFYNADRSVEYFEDAFEHTRERMTKLLQEDLSFALWSTTDQKTSLTLHNARPEAFEPGLADTMIYEMPRKTDAGVDEWKKQIMMTKGEMGSHMSVLGYKLRQGEAGADSWKPQFQPWKLRFTNMAPLPADVDIPQLFLND
ncbi:hypothetical protein L202_06197 [Cryptococcus amylolentus CBS 6039]|uniref:Uncharacterized protein n=1 Tax=Cryptococcus amylolentus CBS 6039 TaxID=1295533 RepID=A0A1E3HIU1_9TREE|nr:hypothetical protein L202_06197 [Cryptococcus amylolentus CBS 6039]ODN76269.1 hypothetical protein L202_06197 [Cryptococcus amylolentus CBS 6039]